MRICELTGIDSIRQFDDRCPMYQSLFNWSEDLEDALWNAGREDPEFLRARIAVCEEALRRFPDEDELMVENRRRAMAESYFELGETDKAEALFEQWLAADPRWGWGWIGWADLHFFATAGRRTTAGPRSCSAAATRRPASGTGWTSPTGSCCCIGRPAVTRRPRRSPPRPSGSAVRTPRVSVRRTIDLEDAGDRAVVRDTATATFEGEGLPLDRLTEIVEALDTARPSIHPRQVTKVGRNAPCPCGSGRKYKKCCGSGPD